ncbi:unnamed protein product [Litomosoides sigmodontis]|uniref:Probable arginine--tRNA ligase, cytoplasmic n=1 Tax=Litomosoides sigmodontis TaxID=42156 RepID=A0A3P6TP44_LITSI|nr:unnamed protein product [Litomosoides sigmodontis]
MESESLSGTSCDRELLQFKQHLEESRKKLATYQNLLESIEKGDMNDNVLEHCPDLSKAVMENAKLEYRMQILQASIHEQEQLNKNDNIKNSGTKVPPKEKSKTKNLSEPIENKKPFTENQKCNYVVTKDFGTSLLYMLRALFLESVSKLYPEMSTTPILITETQQDKFGDYQFNSSMSIAKKLERNGQKISPQEVAREIADNLPKCERIQKTEVAGPGYINIFLNRSWIASSIANIALKGIKIPVIEKRRVVVDFSSPNIAKQMHVGHLRSTIIGDSICRLLTYVGFDVLRLNHIGDWGTQFGMLIAHLQDRFPNFINEIPPISDLQAFYKLSNTFEESKKRFDEDEAFKARSYECVTKLQSFEPDFMKAWQMICDVSRKDLNQIYDRLDIDIVERGESFYQKHMVELVEELDKMGNCLGVLKLDEGRKILRFGEEVPLTVVKSDGGFTYDTSDLAALKYRLSVDKADWIIYVVDAGQKLHFELLYAAGQKLGWYSQTEKRVELVSFGDTVRLTDLLDEGLKRAEIKLQEKKRDKVMLPEELALAREAVAYGCVKYADLSQTRTQDYVFSFDRMLDDRGNTAIYLLYAFARIKSICRNSGVSEEHIQKYINSLPNGVLPLEHKLEFKLAKTILKFTDCILNVLDNFLLHQLCDYVYSLATIFHDFYNECYVIQKDLDGMLLAVLAVLFHVPYNTARIMWNYVYYIEITSINFLSLRKNNDPLSAASAVQTLLYGFFQLIRFALSFGITKKRTQNFDEICHQFEVLQLEFFNAEAVSDACVYLADPHKLPGPAKDSSDSASRNESNTDDGIPSFQYERTNEQGQLGMQYKVHDMSLSSNSDFEKTLLNHFQCTSKFKSAEKSDSSIDFASPLKRRRVNDTTSLLTASTENSKFHTGKGKLSMRNVTKTVSIGCEKSVSGEGRKRRIITDHFDKCSSPVRHFCNASLVASTPLPSKPDNESRLAMMNSAAKTKVRQSKQIVHNLSADSTGSTNSVKREQDAIAKHIARIRTFNPKLNSSSKVSFNDTSRYYSMRTSFGSNSSTCFS